MHKYVPLVTVGDVVLGATEMWVLWPNEGIKVSHQKKGERDWKRWVGEGPLLGEPRPSSSTCKR